MARTASGEVIKPLKANVQPNTGISMKTPSPTSKVYPKVEIRDSSMQIKGDSISKGAKSALKGHIQQKG